MVDVFKELSDKEWVKIKGHLNIEDKQIGLPNITIKVLIDSFMDEILSPKFAGLMRKIILVFHDFVTAFLISVISAIEH